jgi:hypothetical protein
MYSNYDYRIGFNTVFLFQENKSYGIKTICIDPLSRRCCTSRHKQVVLRKKDQLYQPVFLFFSL